MNVIRAIATLLFVGCAAPRTPPPAPALTTTSQHAPIAPDASLAPSDAAIVECPARSLGPRPEVVVVSSLAAAKPHLAAVVPAASEDLKALAAEHGNAFGVRVMSGSLHGSDSTVYDIAAVFVVGKRVVIAKRVAIDISVIPGPDGPPPPMQTTVEILSPKIGHIQIARGDNVTDHFIDLESGVHRLALVSSAPRAWKLDGDSGPISGNCQEWWDD